MFKPDSDIFPADENGVINLLPDLMMNGESRFLARIYMLDRAVTLGLVLKRHDKEILMITLIVSVHDRVTMAPADATGRVNQVDAFHVLVKCSQRKLKNFSCNTWFEIEATQHVEHEKPCFDRS